MTLNIAHKALALLVVCVCLSTFQVVAQETVSNTQVSEQAIKARSQEVEADATLDEELRAQLLESYRVSLGYIETTTSNTGKAKAFELSLSSAPEETASIHEVMDKEPADNAIVLADLPDDISTRELEQRLQSERARESAESTKLVTLEQQITAESGRPEIARQTIQSTRETTDQLAATLKVANPPDESPLISEARRWRLSTQTAATNSEINMLEQELLSQPVRVELLMTRRDQSELTLKRIGARTLLLEQALADARTDETAQIIAASGTTDLSQFQDYPAVADLIKNNQELSDILQSLTISLAEIQTASRLVASNIKEIEQSYQTARQRLEIAGLNKALGQVLHEQRRDLPDSNQYRSDTRQLEEDIADAGLQDIRFAAEWRDMRDSTKYTESKLIDVLPAERDVLAEPIKLLIDKRRVLLRNTRDANSKYLRALTELNFQQSNAQQITAEWDAFLVENLLWVRNKKTINLASLSLLPEELREVLNPQPWLESIRALFSIGFQIFWFWLAVLNLILFTWKRESLMNRLKGYATEVGKPATDSMAYTLRASVLTFLMTLPWPLLIFATGWELTHLADLSANANIIGASLLTVTMGVFYQRALSLLCLSGGLAESHFKWPPGLIRSLAYQTRSLLLTFLLPIFIMSLSIHLRPDIYGGEVARISFVLATIGLGAFIIGLARPETGIFAKLYKQRGHAGRFSWFWFMLGITIPTIYAIAALAGYQYSAVTLMVKLIQSLWLAFGLIIALELVRRWLLVLSGRLNFEAFKEKREALRLAREQQDKTDEDRGDVVLPIEERPLDVASISVETGKLVKFVLIIIGFIGLRGIWASVLPALSIFREVVLWEFLDEVAGQQQVMPVTLADLLMAIVYLIAMVFAARSIPSLVMALLRYSSSITQGSRVAFATLARYTIVIVGISLIASTIGWNWGKIQWLIAAMGVGIGFGLQEIIANFISGIIILVERPIRVGDLVTVGDASGTVTRLQIRATTITNFDRQELLVPNKEFITGRVLNWSLSDEVIRLKVNVGVAYGSDIDLALRLVKEAATEHPLILREPPSLVTFTEFGDNSLNITARCFTNSLNKRREIISDLNLAINKRLAAAGIVIAFPQRDVHLNTNGPLDLRVQNVPAKSE